MEKIDFKTEKSIDQKPQNHPSVSIKPQTKDDDTLSKDISDIPKELFEELQKKINDQTSEYQKGNCKVSDLVKLKREIAEEHFSPEEILEKMSKDYCIKICYRKNPTPDNIKKQIHVIGGPPGSGKSTIIKKILKTQKAEKNLDIVCIDPDELMFSHPNIKQIQALFGEHWGEATTVINRPVRKKIIDALAKKNFSICIEGCKTFANYAKQAIAEGYQATVHLPLVAPLIAQQRSVKRMGDHKNKNIEPRGVLKAEYQDLEKGHHVQALRKVLDLFKDPDIMSAQADTDIILHVTYPDAFKKEKKVKTIEGFLKIYLGLVHSDKPLKETKEILSDTSELSTRSNSAESAEIIADLVDAGQQFNKLSDPERERHIDRVKSTVEYLKLAGLKIEDPQIKPFLETMGVTINEENKPLLYGQELPELIGQNTERSEQDFEHTATLLNLDTQDRKWQELVKRYRQSNSPKSNKKNERV